MIYDIYPEKYTPFMTYCYIRVSTDRQTVENQHYEIDQFCRREGISADSWVKETISGSRDYDKRELGRLLQEVRRGDLIICSELSRFGRSLFMIMEILSICMERGCRVWTVKEGYRLGDDIQSKVLAFAFGLSAEIERQSMQKYTDAKMRVIQNQTPQDAFIYWADDPIIAKELKKYNIKAVQCPFSDIKKNGVIGYIEKGQYMLEYPTPFNMEQESLSLTGRHNIYNSLAAGLAANIAGIKKESIRKSLSDFAGVEHRLEKVCDVRGVHYVNDSKATNVDACWYALESMNTRVVLIIGGKDKGNDYEPIKPLIREKCSALVYLGADNTKLHQNFDGMGIPVRDTHSMRECMEACYELAQPGETVLLSPCCASFDLFKNMEDRGEQFKAIARSL